MFGTIVSISADNLRAYALGGFKEGSFAHRGCRHCMMTSDNLSTTVCFNQVYCMYIVFIPLN